MRRGITSARVIRAAQIGGSALFAVVLLVWASLLACSVYLVCQGEYGGAIALALVCNAIANLGQYSEAWNLRISTRSDDLAQDAHPAQQ